jgi:hypothetical protein
LEALRRNVGEPKWWLAALAENGATFAHMPTLLTPPALEVVRQGLHESEIRCGIQNEPPAGGITAWIDYGSRTEKATFYGTIVGDKEVWPAADRIAAWLHETALRLFPDSPYAKAHGG